MESGSTVIGGVTVGEEAYICRGAIVTRDVPSRAIVYGHNKLLDPRKLPSEEWKFFVGMVAFPERLPDYVVSELELDLGFP